MNSNYNMNDNIHINSRLLARLISNSGFKKLIDKEDSKQLAKQLKLIISKGDINFKNKKKSIKDVLDFSYSHLQKDYRHEYIYKTKLLSSYILNNYSLHDTVILNEFKIGNSIADIALVNGTNKIFEIKTELDSPERLKTQIADYYKGFSQIYIVTHYSLLSKYESILKNEIGIIIFNENNSLTTYRDAIVDNSHLDNITMMKSLKKGEFLDIVISLHGNLPDVTQVALYKECLKLVMNINSSELQKYFLNKIKSRSKSNFSFFNTEIGIPDYLKFFCYINKINEKQYLSLPARLSCMV